MNARHATMVAEMEKRAEEMREFSVKEAVQAAGYDRLTTSECREIIYLFTRRHPTYRPVKMMTREQLDRRAYWSLFDVAYVTELEYDDKPYDPANPDGEM